MLSQFLPLTLLLCIRSILATQEVVIKANDTSEVLFTPAGTAGWEYSGPSSTTDCGGDYKYSMNDNSELTVVFTGIAFSLNLIRFSTGARAAIELDGVPQTVVDTFSSITDCTTPTFTKSGLNYTQHRLKVTDATHNTVSRWIRFKSLTYTDYTQIEKGPALSSASVASVSTASVASASSVSVTSAIAAASAAAERREKKARTGRTAGGVVGGILGLLLIVGGIVWARLKKRSKSAKPVDTQPAMQYNQQPPVNAWKDQPSPYPSPAPYPAPGNPPYPNMMMDQSTGQASTANGSTTNFANYPGYPVAGLPYQQTGLSGTAPSQGYGSPMPQYPQPMHDDRTMSMGQPQAYGPPMTQVPQPMYGDRPMPQYVMQPNGPGNMGGDMAGAQVQYQQGGPPPGAIAEPMDIRSNARQASGMPSGYHPYASPSVQLAGSPSPGLGLHMPNLPQPM